MGFTSFDVRLIASRGPDFLTAIRFLCCHREGHAAKSALSAADLEAKICFILGPTGPL
jgi:hypothetical protein